MTTDTERRLLILQNDPVCTGISTSVLTYRLEQALRKALSYTNRSEDVGQGWDGIIVELAINSILMSGADNSTSVSEGGISRTWSDIPDSLKSRLNSYRLVIGLHTSEDES